MKTLTEIRGAVEHCRNTDNIGCTELIKYRDQTNVEGANHPVLFQIVPKVKIMVIGAVPGSIAADARKVAYQKLVNAQFSLGDKSAKGLGEIMMQVGNIKGIDLPTDIIRVPNTETIQDKHLLARERLGLHVTNLVKCDARTGWEKTKNKEWTLAANSCANRHLTHEFEIMDPPMVILLGQQVLDYIAERESWRMKRKDLKISTWAAEQAGYFQCYGKERFVTAWTHPGGNYFHIQGREHWGLYAEQMADYIN